MKPLNTAQKLLAALGVDPFKLMLGAHNHVGSYAEVTLNAELAQMLSVPKEN